MDPALFQRYKATGDARLAGELLAENIALVTLLTAQLCGWKETGNARRRSLAVLPAAYLLSHEEAMQCGRIGFARALQSFDPTKGKIAHYTALWIRATLQSAISSHHNTRKAGVSFVELDAEPLGQDDSAATEASADYGPRVRRAVGRMTREERRVFQAMCDADFEMRAAARALGLTTTALEAAWAPIRRSMASPPFLEELEGMRRFIASACVRAPSAHVTNVALRDAYAAHVERDVSMRRVGIVVARLAPSLGIRQIVSRTFATVGVRAGPFGVVAVSQRVWVGMRLVEGAPEPALPAA